jgi:ribonuclease P protein component
MLPGENRLIQKKDFEEIHRSGSFFSFGRLSLKIKKNNLNRTRIGFSIGIKFSPKAVERNKLKRQLRELVRKELERLQKGFDIIISVNSKEKNVPSEELEKNLNAIFKKAKLI